MPGACFGSADDVVTSTSIPASNRCAFWRFIRPGMLAYPGWSGEGDHFIGKGSNQIEYEDGDPEIRAAFEAELAKNGLQSRCGRSSVKNAGKYKRPSRSAVGNCLLLLIS